MQQYFLAKRFSLPTLLMAVYSSGYIYTWIFENWVSKNINSICYLAI